MSKAIVTADTVIATCALIVAAMSLFFTINQDMKSREHDLISLEPHIGIEYHADHQDLSYSVDVTNSGNGPARIKSFKTFIQGTSFEIGNLESQLVHRIRLKPINCCILGDERRWFENGDVLGTNLSKKLYFIKLDIKKLDANNINKTDAFKLLLDIFNEFEIKITYSGFHEINEKFAVLERKRHLY